MRDNWLSNHVFDSADALLRSLLRCLEQARGSAIDHHVHRHARLGASVLISESWYNPAYSGFKERRYDRPSETIVIIQVKVDMLDNVLRAHPGRPVSLIKIDDEGAEYQVLRGSNLLHYARQAVYRI